MRTAEQLLLHYQPYFQWDSQEQFFPIDLQSYITNCELYVDDTKVKESGEVTYDSLMKILENQAPVLTALGKPNGELRLRPSLNPSDPRSQIIFGRKDWQQSARIYGKVFNETIQESNGTELDVYALHYIFLYAYDNPTTCLPFFKKDKNPQWHFGDLENVSIYVLQQDTADGAYKKGDIYKAYFSQHGSGEGECVFGNRITIIHDASGKHALVYVARGSHASYPHPGTICRVMGFGNDVIRPEDGATPQKLEVVVDEPLFLMGNFNLGYDHVGSKKDFWDISTELGQKYYSTSWLMRCFCIAFSTCPDACYTWLKYGKNAKGFLMSYDHQVIAATHISKENILPIYLNPVREDEQKQERAPARAAEREQPAATETTRLLPTAGSSS